METRVMAREEGRSTHMRSPRCGQTTKFDWLRTLRAVVCASILGTFQTVSVPNAHAGVPPSVHFQGSLSDHTGEPVDGAMGMEFRLYDAPGDEALLLWESSPLCQGSCRLLGSAFQPTNNSDWGRSGETRWHKERRSTRRVSRRGWCSGSARRSVNRGPRCHVRPGCHRARSRVGAIKRVESGSEG